MNLICLAAEVQALEIVRHRQSFCHVGGVAQSVEGVAHRQAGLGDDVPPPAAADHHGAGSLIRLHQLLGIAQHRVVIHAAKATIAHEEDIADRANLLAGKQKLVIIAGVFSGHKLGENVLAPLGKAADAAQTALGAVQLGGSYHFHGLGNLLRIFHAPDTGAYLTHTGHSVFPPFLKSFFFKRTP